MSEKILEVHHCTYVSEPSAQFQDVNVRGFGKEKTLVPGNGIIVWKHTCTSCGSVNFSVSHFDNTPPDTGRLFTSDGKVLKVRTPARRKDSEVTDQDVRDVMDKGPKDLISDDPGRVLSKTTKTDKPSRPTRKRSRKSTKSAEKYTRKTKTVKAKKKTAKKVVKKVVKKVSKKVVKKSAKISLKRPSAAAKPKTKKVPKKAVRFRRPTKA